MAFLEAKFGPCAPFGDSRIHGFFDHSGADTLGCLYTFPVVVETIGYNGFGPVFVGSHLLRRQS